MTEGRENKDWYHHVGGWLATVFRNLSGVRGLTGIFAIGMFAATVFAAWRYPESSFGKFSQTLGVAITSVFVGLWGADYYYRRDAYKKRYRDVAVSVYTTWLLIVGVETIKKHIENAKLGVAGMKPANDTEHGHKLNAHSEIEAGHTAAELIIKMGFMALTNLELFSEDAVKAGKAKFAINEQEATVRQQVREGAGATGTTASELTAETANSSGNGGNGNG